MRRWVLVLGAAALAALAAVRACREAPAPQKPTLWPADPRVELPPPPPDPLPPARTKSPDAFVPPPETRIVPETILPPPAAATTTASVWGRVTMQGPRPSRKRIRQEADPHCAALHAEGMLSDDLVVGPESQVRWALLHVSKGLGGRRFDPPTTPARLEQVACRYEPHVLGLQVEQPLEIVNRDPLLHNVHGLPFDNKEFNLGQPRGAVDVRRFTRPEIFKVKCDVHPWMSAWIGVFDHPYFAVTDDEGVYRLAELPPGRYEIRAWHEGLAAETLEVEVGSIDVRRDFLLQRR